ncbi:MAG: GGDEF domain-containing protein [Rhizobiaceae bacterium]
MSNISYLHDVHPDGAAMASMRERAVLDALAEGIIVLSGGEAGGVGDEVSFYVTFANKRAAVMLDREPDELDQVIFEDILPRGRFAKLHDAITSVYATGEPERRTVSLTEVADEERCASRLIADLIADTREDGERRIIVTLQPAADVSALMDGPDVLEASREDLQREVLKLRRELDMARRLSAFDPNTGLPDRAGFLERATAEFQRSVRYDHELAVIVIKLSGDDKKIDMVDEQNLNALAQICESLSRHGIDIVGRHGPRELAMLLPETGVPGGLRLANRLQEAIERAPMMIAANNRETHIRIATDAMQSDDFSFVQMFERARLSLR